jgi:hypothetical protein
MSFHPPLPCCRYCGWLIYRVRLADHTDLWFDTVHDDMRCLINGLHEPADPLPAVEDLRTAVSGR